MLRLVTGAVLSFLVSDWIYSEIVLTLPQVGETIEAVYYEVKIPTHDEWPEGIRTQTNNLLKQASRLPLTTDNWGGALERVLAESTNALETLRDIQERRNGFGRSNFSSPTHHPRLPRNQPKSGLGGV